MRLTCGVIARLSHAQRLTTTLVKRDVSNTRHDKRRRETEPRVATAPNNGGGGGSGGDDSGGAGTGRPARQGPKAQSTPAAGSSGLTSGAADPALSGRAGGRAGTPRPTLRGESIQRSPRFLWFTIIHDSRPVVPLPHALTNSCIAIEVCCYDDQLTELRICIATLPRSLMAFSMSVDGASSQLSLLAHMHRDSTMGHASF